MVLIRNLVLLHQTNALEGSLVQKCSIGYFKNVLQQCQDICGHQILNHQRPRIVNEIEGLGTTGPSTFDFME